MSGTVSPVAQCRHFIGEPSWRQSGIFCLQQCVTTVALGSITHLQRPTNGQAGIIGPDPTFRRGNMAMRMEVQHLAFVTQGLETVRASGRDHQRARSIAGELDGMMLAESHGSTAEVDHDIMDPAAQASDYLPFPMRRVLEMHAAHCAAPSGEGAVDLDDHPWMAAGAQLLLIVETLEETALITDRSAFQQPHSDERRRNSAEAVVHVPRHRFHSAGS
jgi:hypothetical protein